MTTPDPTKNPAPMIPPMAIIMSCRCDKPWRSCGVAPINRKSGRRRRRASHMGLMHLQHDGTLAPLRAVPLYSNRHGAQRGGQAGQEVFGGKCANVLGVNQGF